MEATEMKQALTQVFDKVAPDFDQTGIEYHRPIGRRLVEFASIKAGEHVLDVGTGRGAALFEAAAVTGEAGRAVGIDLSAAMIEHVRADAARLGLGFVEAHTMDGENPEFPAGSFDAILGSFSINMFPHALEALSRYPALLRPGGRLAFTTPVFHDDGLPTTFPATAAEAFQKLFAKWREAGVPQQFVDRSNSWYADPGRLTETLKKAGFDRVEIEHEPVVITVPSGEAWVRWTYTEGLRMFWELIPADERKPFEDEIVAGMNASRDADGTISYPHPVRYVLAEPRADREA
jgi:O-methyltransferase/aklanonic acid methyltransferase